MSKYIKKFDTISGSKEATLYSPTLISVYNESGDSRVLMADVQTDNTELCVKGELLPDLYITGKTSNKFYIDYSGQRYERRADSGMTFAQWVDNPSYNIPIRDDENPAYIQGDGYLTWGSGYCLNYSGVGTAVKGTDVIELEHVYDRSYFPI